MQPIRKKNRKKGSWLLLALPMLLGLLLIWQLSGKAPAKKGPEHEERVQLIRRTEQELLRIDFYPEKGPAYALVQADGRFEVAGWPTFEVDKDQLALIIRDFTVLDANELVGQVHGHEEELAGLGLGQEAARAKATYSDGSQLTLIFGASSRDHIPADYLMIAGQDKVYTVSPETREHFDRPLASLRQVPRINFNASLVDRMVVEGADGFELYQQEGLWQLSSPVNYPADAEKMSSLLKSISKMRFALYAAEGDEAARFGLDKPGRSITFHLSASIMQGFDTSGQLADSRQVDAQQLTITLGDNIENIGLYCLYEGRIYQASNLSMGFLRDVDWQDLLSGSPVTLPLNRLSRLEVVGAGQQRAYQIELVEKILPNTQVARDEQGQILYEPLITRDGQPMEQADFVQAYLRLMDLRRAGRLPADFQQPAEQALRIYRLHSGDSLQTLALYPLDELHYALSVNGHFVDYVTRSAADSIGL